MSKKTSIILTSVALGLSVLIFLIMAFPLFAEGITKFSQYNLLKLIKSPNWHEILIGGACLITIISVALLVISLCLTLLTKLNVIKVSNKINLILYIVNISLSVLLLCSPILLTIGSLRDIYGFKMFDIIAFGYFVHAVVCVAIVALTAINIVKNKK